MLCTLSIITSVRFFLKPRILLLAPSILDAKSTVLWLSPARYFTLRPPAFIAISLKLCYIWQKACKDRFIRSGSENSTFNLIILMELHLMHFLIVCPLVFLAGFVDAVAGGGGLISLPAYMIAGLPVHFAIGTNKLSSGMGTTLATARFAKNGYIAWKNALLCIVTALIGSSLGAKLALQLDDYYFKRLILVILPCTALYLTFGKPFVGEKESFPVRKMILFSALIAFIIGIYDGFYGPGTGTFLLLLLTGIAHMGLKEANGITKAINLTTNLTALAVYLMNGKVIFLLGLIAGIFSIAGNYLGTRCFDKGGAKFVKPLMMVVLVIFFIKTLSEILGA